MKTSLKTALFLIVFGLMVVSTIPVKAQCSQCAAQVETNSKNGGNAAKGLNKGIMFLLGAPYFAVAAVGLIWYKKYRRKNVDINMRDEKLHLN
ncbi:MAG: hypothetical protein JWR09_936 [Mucilaginibacter sp.]|nr:hypothetical protein [Mucilaginibacter sp.]